LRALILCASFVRSPAPPWLQWIQEFNHPVWFQFQLPRQFVRYTAALWDCDAAVIDDLIENTSTVAPAVLSHRFAQVMQVDVRAALQCCQLPLLYLRATRDLLVQRHNWEEIVRLKPDAQLAEIDASHFVLQHKPAAALQAITDFLAANFAA
jgi:pimeloyl-ACP methyl ester carboxylesterase